MPTLLLAGRGVETAVPPELGSGVGSGVGEASDVLCINLRG